MSIRIFDGEKFAERIADKPEWVKNLALLLPITLILLKLICDALFATLVVLFVARILGMI